MAEVTGAPFAWLAELPASTVDDLVTVSQTWQDYLDKLREQERRKWRQKSSSN